MVKNGGHVVCDVGDSSGGDVEWCGGWIGKRGGFCDLIKKSFVGLGNLDLEILNDLRTDTVEKIGKGHVP